MKLLKKMLLVGSVLAMASAPAMAAFTFTNGDVILGFQALGGTGSTENVYFNLGASTALRDLNGQGRQLGNINTTLSNTFGGNWYSRNDVYFGVFGNLNFGANTGLGAQAAVGGDPSRTIYSSLPTAAPGGAAVYSAGAYTGNNLGSVGSNFSGLETRLNTFSSQADNATVQSGANAGQTSQSWTYWNPTTNLAQSAAFGFFSGGIQQNFGKATGETYVDVQRILSTNTGANPTGTIGGGTFEYTVAVGSDGNIRVVPEVSSTLLLGAIGLAAAFQRRRFQLV